MAITDLIQHLLTLNVLNTFKQLFPFIVKAIIGLLFLVNIRSWPLAWHIRVFRPVVYLYTRHFLLKLKLLILLKSRKEKILLEEKWLDSTTPIGKNPFDMVVKYNSWSSLDDCDFYGHMSNSSYATTFDAVRFKAAMLMFPRLFAPGGWIAIGETHFHYIREIPILSPYEVRMRIASWDEKWMYLVCKFVTKPKRKSKSKHTNSSVPNSTADTLPTPSASGTNTPSLSNTTPSLINSTTTTHILNAASPTLKSVASTALTTEEPDGAIINAVTVATCCFKIGRITIPPAVVLALNGFAAPASSSLSPSTSSSTSTSSPTQSYSHSNPPPHWAEVQALSCRSNGGSIRDLAQFMRGGWKDVPEGERWWDDALAGVEERRKVGMEGFVWLRRGMEAARA